MQVEHTNLRRLFCVAHPLLFIDKRDPLLIVGGDDMTPYLWYSRGTELTHNNASIKLTVPKLINPISIHQSSQPLNIQWHVGLVAYKCDSALVNSRKK